MGVKLLNIYGYVYNICCTKLQKVVFLCILENGGAFEWFCKEINTILI